MISQGIYVTSFFSILYWSNSDLTLLRLSVFLFERQDWVKTEYQTKVRSLSTS